MYSQMYTSDVVLTFFLVVSEPQYQDEADKAVSRMNGKEIDGREIVVQFAKYGRNEQVREPVMCFH